MPSQHRYPAITPRPHPELKRRAQEAVAELGTDLNAYVIGCLEYLVGDRPEAPARPARTMPRRPDDAAAPAGEAHGFGSGAQDPHRGSRRPDYDQARSAAERTRVARGR